MTSFVFFNCLAHFWLCWVGSVAEVGGDLWRSPWPPTVPSLVGSLDGVCPGLGWNIPEDGGCSTPWGSAQSPAGSGEVFCWSQSCSVLCSCVFPAGHHWAEPGCSLWAPSLQAFTATAGSQLDPCPWHSNPAKIQLTDRVCTPRCVVDLSSVPNPQLGTARWAGQAGGAESL